MTKEEREKAIDLLDNLLGMVEDNQDNDYDKALKMGIESLRKEPCEDVVSRKEAIDTITHWFSDMLETGKEEYSIDDVLNSLPSVTATRKKGKWEQYGNYWEDKFKCSECGKEQPKILCGERIIGHWSDYCPNCGAEMESEE